MSTRPTPDPTDDFFDGFAAAPPEADPVPSGRTMLLTSAALTLVGVLGTLAFVGGAMWASFHEPDLDYTNVAGEFAIKVAYALFVGAICGGAVVALAVAVVGFFVLRERRHAIRGRTATAQPRAKERPRPSAPAAAPPPDRPRRDRSH